MVAFDHRRAARIVGETAESYREMLVDHQSDVTYTTPEEMLRQHAELEQDYLTMNQLKERLEMDCE